MKLAGQILGIVITVVCIFSVQLREKWQMLSVSAGANALQALSYYLILSSFTSAMVLCAVAALQCLLNIVHHFKGTAAGTVEKIVFLILFLAAGFLQYRSPPRPLANPRRDLLYDGYVPKGCPAYALLRCRQLHRLADL